MDAPPSLPIRQQSVWPLVIVSIALAFGLTIGAAFAKREEIRTNWSKYRSDPLYMFAAPFFKPDSDPRSAFQFAADSFSDAIQDILSRVFAAFVDPILRMFSVFAGAMDQTVGSLFVMRGMLDKLYSGFRQMVDVFARRYTGVLHQLRMTFTRLQDAMGKTFGVAISSVYAGLSTIYSMLSFMDLLMKIVITILVVLVVMIVLLFFVLWPFIPLILSVLGILGAAGFGGALGGMQDAFGCFDGATQIVLANGDRVPARDIRLGTELGYGAGAVRGLLCFEQEDCGTYLLHGVQVSGSHIVYDAAGAPHFVKDCPEARLLPLARRTVYCFITDSRRVPVQSDIGVLEFADWEELEDDDADALCEWHERVHAALNGGFVHYVPPTPVALASEAVVSAHSRIRMPGEANAVEIASVYPGMYVCDADGAPTRVLGIVRVSGKAVAGAAALDAHTRISAGAWIRRASGPWTQPMTWSAPTAAEEDAVWYSLFTEAGTYCLEGAGDAADPIGIRDFSDVGLNTLSDTYGFVLDRLTAPRH
jgi:hypothetical protein